MVLTAARKETGVRFERANFRRLADTFKSWTGGAVVASCMRRRLGKGWMMVVNGHRVSSVGYAREALGAKKRDEGNG